VDTGLGPWSSGLVVGRASYCGVHCGGGRETTDEVIDPAKMPGGRGMASAGRGHPE